MEYLPKRIQLGHGDGLDKEVMLALKAAAEAEGRDPKSQAGQMIIEGLKARGFLGQDSSVVVIVQGVSRGVAQMVEALHEGRVVPVPAGVCADTDIEC